MPRSRPIREPCDCRDCAEPGPPPLHVQAAIARQEPPPKSLLILLHNVTAFSELSSFTAFPHLTAMVRDGSSGFLTTDTACRSLKDSVESLLKDGSACASSSLQSRFQDLHAISLTDDEAVNNMCQTHYCLTTNIVMERTCKDNCLRWQDSEKLAKLVALHLGIPFVTLPTLETAAFGLELLTPTPTQPTPPDMPLPSQDSAGGTQGDDCDMLLLLLDASPPPSPAALATQPGAPLSQAPATSQAPDVLGSALPSEAPHLPEHTQQMQQAADLPEASGSSAGGREWGVRVLEWLDSLLMHLNKVPGFKDTVLLTVVLGMQPHLAAAMSARHLQRGAGPVLGARTAGTGYQQEQGPEVQHARGQDMRGGSPPRWAFRRPLQSYQFRGTERVDPHPESLSVVVHRLPGVIRRDAVQQLSLEEVARVGGGGCILADRVLPEVAYKLGRAPKYGA